MSFLPGMEPEPRLPEPTAEEDDFYTPKWLLDWLPPIGLDPCWAVKSNVVVDRAGRIYDLRLGDDGLARRWHVTVPHAQIVWANPPYSDCARWVARCREQAYKNKVTVVALIPAKPGEAYWHEHIWPVAESVGFLRGRVRFDTVNGPAKDASTFGLALVLWGPQAGKARATITERSKSHAQRPVWVKKTDWLDDLPF